MFWHSFNCDHWWLSTSANREEFGTSLLDVRKIQGVWRVYNPNSLEILADGFTHGCKAREWAMNYATRFHLYLDYRRDVSSWQLELWEQEDVLDNLLI